MVIKKNELQNQEDERLIDFVNGELVIRKNELQNQEDEQLVDVEQQFVFKKISRS